MANKQLEFRRYETTEALIAAKTSFAVGDVVFDKQAKVIYIVTAKSGTTATLEPYYGNNAIANVTCSNATLTITFSDGTTTTKTINNVANAQLADKANNDSDNNPINTTYLKKTGGEVTGNVSFRGGIDTSALITEDIIVKGTARVINGIESNGDITASNFIGNLSGNASTATTAIECSGNAATATTLQTSRNINGTSFNGSSAITTAKWGTARTITVKDNDETNSQSNTSIDGSADFTLKLPSTIKATFVGNLTGSVTGDVSGNASTANKATKDSNDKNITDEYLHRASNTSSTLSRFSGSPEYLLGIENFSNGGEVKWQTASTISVGSATSATNATNATNSIYLGNATNGYTYSQLVSALAGKSDSTHNHDSSYLKVTGGTISGNINVTGESNLSSITASSLLIEGNSRFVNEIQGTINYSSKLGTADLNYTYETLTSILSGKSDTSHTHNYAGSSSAGGNATKADTIKTEAGTSDVYRNVFFAWAGDNSKVVFDSDFQYNPASNTLKIGTGTLTATSYSGNAATATSASSIPWDGIDNKPDLVTLADDQIINGAKTFNSPLVINSSLETDSVSTGALIVNGNAVFNNGLVGNLTGTSTGAPWSGITGKPTALSAFTDDLGTNPSHSHSQYLLNTGGKIKKDSNLVLGSTAIPYGQEGANDWTTYQHSMPLEVGRSSDTWTIAIGCSSEGYGVIQNKAANISSSGRLYIQPTGKTIIGAWSIDPDSDLTLYIGGKTKINGDITSTSSITAKSQVKGAFFNINDGCTLQYNSTYKYVSFNFS